MTAIILRRRKLGRTSAREIAACSATGIKVVRNWMPRDWADAGQLIDYVFRWGCTSESSRPEAKTVNTAQAIRWCSNKRQGRLDMQEAGVPVPKTWGSVEEWFNAIPAGEIKAVVARPEIHAQGRHLLLSNNPAKFNQFAQAHGSIYLSEYIKKVAEYRVLVCQGRVVWVAQKTPGNPEDVAWNVARGGRFDNVRWAAWPMEVIKAAIAAANVSKTDFCGVDVMSDEDGKPYVLEVNSAPSQTSPYRQSCLAKAFDYIVKNGKQHFPSPAAYMGWKDVIHPAVRGKDDDA